MRRAGHFSAWNCCGCHQLYHCSSPSILSLELINARTVPDACHNHLAEFWAGYPLQFTGEASHDQSHVLPISVFTRSRFRRRELRF